MPERIPCGQTGCNRSFTRRGDRTKHLRNHHLSRLNIQPVLLSRHRSSSPLSRRSGSTPPSNVSTPERSPLASPQPPGFPDDLFDQRDQPDFNMHDPNNPAFHDHNERPPSTVPNPSPSPTAAPDPPIPPQPGPSGSHAPDPPPGIHRVFHPHINGMSLRCLIEYTRLLTLCILVGTPCDKDGKPIPVGTLPPPRDTDNGPNDWFPYTSRAEFELCDLLYRKSEMPAGQIDELLNIIAAMQAESGGEAAFASHRDLYSTIDATKLGDAPWDHFNLDYQGEKNEPPLPWQTEEFTVWFRDPQKVIQNLLSNPDFDKGFDYAPFQEHDAENNHRYENFMSGNWCWRQSVCFICFVQLSY